MHSAHTQQYWLAARKPQVHFLVLKGRSLSLISASGLREW